jgi:hypothetical protein
MYLIVRIMPRSLQRGVLVELNESLSFVLYGVDLAGRELANTPAPSWLADSVVQLGIVEHVGKLISTNPMQYKDFAFAQPKPPVRVRRKTGWLAPVDQQFPE